MGLPKEKVYLTLTFISTSHSAPNVTTLWRNFGLISIEWKGMEPRCPCFFYSHWLELILKAFHFFLPLKANSFKRMAFNINVKINIDIDIDTDFPLTVETCLFY